VNQEIRSQRRIPRLAAAGAGLALLGGAALSQLGADAEPVSSDVPTTCSIATSSFELTVPVVVDDTIDPVVEGGQEIVVLDTGLPELPVEVTIDRLVVTLPTPSQIASVDDVTFSGGNMAGSWAASGSDLVLTFTGPQSSSAMDLPTVTIDQTVATDVAPTTIEWLTFSKIDADTNYGMATCVPDDPNQVVNTTRVEAADPEPTEPVEPTEPTPTTTVPDEPTPEEPAEPTPTEPPAEDDSDVSVSVDVEADLPDLPGMPPVPTAPGAPVPAPGGPGAPGLPTAPALPPLPSDPPTLPLPGGPEAPAPTPTPSLPALPGIPEVELDAEATLEVGIGF
jgi:hypothetical protein